jgi:hypothetical protein
MKRIEFSIDPPPPTPPELTVFPIPLRPGVVVKIHIPHDLTRFESERIAEVVRAFAVVPEPKSNLRKMQRHDREREAKANAAWRAGLRN